VVVVGGGMMGASLLYHLALEGCTDTLLIEKSELTSGSTWHAAGQCPSITGSYNLAKIHAYSNQLYPRSKRLTGQYVSWHACGGLRLATNPHELDWLKYVYGYSKSIGFSMEIVGLDEIRRLNPFLTTDNVIAGAWTTDDGHGDPSGLCNALAKAARELGATVMRHNRVLDIRATSSGEWEVVTDKGSIDRGDGRQCRRLLRAPGSTAMVGSDAPITNMQHHYVVTHPIPAFMERSEEIPVMRDSYTSGYFRQEQKSGLMGVYESTGLQEAWAPRGFPEWEASNELFPDDLDRIAPWLERAIERMPIFGEVGIRRVINGAIPHTPDGAPLLGPAAGLKNFLDVLRYLVRHRARRRLRQVSCAVDAARRRRNQHDGIRSAALRQICRCKSYVRDKVFLDYRIDLHHAPPGEEEMAGRPQQNQSPVREAPGAGLRAHRDLRLGAPQMVFTRRPRAEDYSYARNNVFEVVRAEVAAVHERVGVLDLTGFAKYDISGPGAESFLNRICANKVPRKTGGMALVHLLSPGGRILGEMTVSRLGDRFYALSAAAAELRDQDVLMQGVRPGERCALRMSPRIAACWW
jgi:dimethylglycine dehydrogenase